MDFLEQSRPTWGCRQHDAKITVKYTLGGCTAEASRDVSVRRPASVTSGRGYSGYTLNGQRMYRNYFHIVRDQWYTNITLTGMPVSEQVVRVYGRDTDVTSSSTTTQVWPAEEDQWLISAVAVRDVLECPSDMENSLYRQDLTVGGWDVSPTYDIYMQPSDPNPDNELRIWKQEHQ
jgi:hypothetical protein